MKKYIALALILIALTATNAGAWGGWGGGGSSSTGVNTTYDADSDGVIDADKVATLNQNTTGSAATVTDAELAAIQGLTFADKSIIQLTGAGAAAVLTCTTANQIIGVNAANDALECKDTLNLSTINLPSTDADPGTTAGQIRHDTTSTESSARGVVKFYNGTNVGTFIHTGTDYTLVTKYQYLPIRYAEDDVSVAAPAAAAEIGTTSLIARSFAEDADNGVIFFLQVPSDFVSGIKYRVYYAIDTNAGADETAAFSLAGCSVGNLDALACAEGTAVVVTDELDDTYDTGELIVTDWSAAVTVTDIAAGEMASLLLIRDVSEDDMVGHALIAGIEIKYVGKINPFSDY